MHSKSKILIFIVALSLSLLAHFRTPFSPDTIAAPMQELAREIEFSYPQNYHFLAAGRQSFAFVSDDGKIVLKFFNKKYLEMPWYSFLFSGEKEKREKRKKYFDESYFLAEKFLAGQTGLLYVHLGKTKNLPKIVVQDGANRQFAIDLNSVPFILQRKGELIYDSLQKIYETKGEQAFLSALDDFLDLIALRITLGIADGDHDVEHNYGFLDDKPFHLDPGRLYLRDLSSKHALTHEWWVGTHGMRKWLKKAYPDLVSQFDEMEKKRCID